MDDVIENCQTTFEEDGVNQQTLDDLRKVGLFSSSWSLWSILLQQLIFIVAGSIFCNFSALRFVQFKKFGFFIDASSQILAWRNVRFFFWWAKFVRILGGCRAFDSFLCCAPLFFTFYFKSYCLVNFAEISISQFATLTDPSINWPPYLLQYRKR